MFLSNNLQQQLPYQPVPQQQGIPTAPPLQTALNRPQYAFPTIPGKRKKTVLQKEDQTVINDKHSLATPLIKRRLSRAKRKLRNRQPDTAPSSSLRNPQRGSWKRLKSKQASRSPFRLQYVSNRFQDAFPTISSARTIRSLPRLRDGLHRIHHRSILA